MAPLTTAARSLRPKAVVPAPVVDITPAPLPSPVPAPAAALPPRPPRAPSSVRSASSASTGSSGSSGSRSGASIPETLGRPLGDARRVAFRGLGDGAPASPEARAAMFDATSSPHQGPQSPISHAPAGWLGKYLEFLLAGVAGTAVFAAGPLLFPGLIGPPRPDADGNPLRRDPVMWGLAALAVAAVVYALVATYRSL